MSSLQNRNVFHLPFNAHSTPVVLRDNLASNAPSLSRTGAHTPRSLFHTSNAALAHLKALGPRLTPAQRESIALLQKHESAVGSWDGSTADVTTAQAKRSFCHDDTVLQRRASFKLV